MKRRRRDRRRQERIQELESQVEILQTEIAVIKTKIAELISVAVTYPDADQQNAVLLRGLRQI